MKRCLVILSMVFVTQSCVSQKITARELKREMDAKTPVHVINVLNTNSFRDCSIQGSVNIPMDKLANRSKKWKKDKPIVVHCASYECPLSGYAQTLLQKKGFTNVREFAGGSREWYQKGYPVNGPCKAGYLQK